MFKRHYFAERLLCNKGPLVKAMVFPVVTYGCKSQTIKKAECQRIDAFELWCCRRLFESPLDCKEIQPVHPKGNQSWIFTGRTDAEAEPPILWLPDVKTGLIGKDPDAGNYWGQEEKEETENKMAGWHHQTNGHEFEQTPGDSEGQGSLVSCSPWGRKQSDTTQQLNNNLCSSSMLNPPLLKPLRFPSLWLRDWTTEQQVPSWICICQNTHTWICMYP